MHFIHFMFKLDIATIVVIEDHRIKGVLYHGYIGKMKLDFYDQIKNFKVLKYEITEDYTLIII